MSESLGWIIDLIPTFDGELSANGSAYKLNEFIENCDLAMELVEPVHTKVLLFIIHTKIKGRARAYIRIHEDLPDWDALKALLLDTFGEKRTRGQLLLHLNLCRQECNETIASYSSKVETCYFDLLESFPQEERNHVIDILEMQLLHAFLNGLNKTNRLVKKFKPKSFKDAVELAFAIEQGQIQRNQNANNTFGKFCTYCQRSGHTFSNCRSKNESNDVPSNSIKICNYCKNRGHLIHECRKRQRNNSYNNNNQNFNGNYSNNNNRNYS